MLYLDEKPLTYYVVLERGQSVDEEKTGFLGSIETMAN